MINTLTNQSQPPTTVPAGPSRAIRRGSRPPSTPPALRKLLVALLVGGTISGATLAAAPAWAVEQGGADPDGPSQSGPSQGGVDPQEPTPPAPAPAPEPAPPAPSYTPGPGAIPAPPQEAPYQPYQPQTYSEPNYETTYNPAPSRPYTLPRPTAPVRPIAPPPKTLRVGNFVVHEEQLKRDAPWLSDRQRNSINDWAAYGESKIAQGLISVGVPEDEASRQAAATIIGVALGGVTGAAAVGIPAAVVGGVGGAIVGAGVGAIVGSIPSPGPQTPGAIAAGAGIGLVAGAAVLGVPAAIAGGVAGAALGGIAAHTLGAGDPGANPRQPALPGQPDPKAPRPQPRHAPAPLSNPGANQFELHVPAAQAGKAGLPGNSSVHYQVNVRGDVNAQATVGGQTVKANWSGQQAQAPYKALGNAAAQAQKTVHDVTRQATDQIERVVPGARALWPQESAPTPAPKPAPKPVRR